MNSKLQEYMDIPWGNLVHSYGRASDFPPQVERLLNKDNDVYAIIKSNIEHQDTIWPATPFMLRVLLELINNTQADNEQLLTIYKRVWNATDNFITHYKDAVKQTMFKLDDILNSDMVWPDFIGDDEDEEAILWEEFDYTQQDWFNCCCLSLDLFKEYSQQIRDLSNLDDKYKELANNLYNRIESFMK
ncbi:hypothetical protein D0T84_11755 [Dysgonomonas sp. 521]|uniref:hypothetical protein n=1 Tax=Dysgonomonas sp. 521 TaxID=2302932 RepID=UPI0013D3CC11|nr:hypothetical protein [Dysgonomonas sp. 521]NDV95580.1 hypothetical protein [Dysgonomonas sp. 521]